MVVSPFGILASFILYFIFPCFGYNIDQIFAGGDLDRSHYVRERNRRNPRRTSISKIGESRGPKYLQDYGESIQLRQITDNHNNRGHEAQDEEDSYIYV